MTRRPKVVLDTNVFLSSLLRSKSCLRIFEMLAQRSFILILSDPLLTELKTVLTSKEFGNIADSDIKLLFETIVENCEIVRPRRSITNCRDTDDNKFLEAAVESKAGFVVSGDRDLLILKSIEGIPILSPKEFISRFERI